MIVVISWLPMSKLGQIRTHTPNSGRSGLPLRPQVIDATHSLLIPPIGGDGENAVGNEIGRLLGEAVLGLGIEAE
jgi:hypothetical protein